MKGFDLPNLLACTKFPQNPAPHTRGIGPDNPIARYNGLPHPYSTCMFSGLAWLYLIYRNVPEYLLHAGNDDAQ
jgi:hypothetical protein